MLLYQEKGYKFISRSNGIIVLKGHIYKGWYETLEKALNHIFG